MPLNRRKIFAGSIKMRPSGPASVEKNSRASLAVLLYGGFVVTGMATTLLGPILPLLTVRWNLDDAHAGLLFTAQFAGSMAGVLLSSVILTRRGFRPSLVSGFAAMGIGIATLEFASWTVGLACVACYGLGLGLTIPTTNLLIAEANPHRRAAALNILNFAWGLGAVALPFITNGFLKIGHASATLLGLGVAALLFSLVFAGTRLGVRQDSPWPEVDNPKIRLARADVRTLAILGVLFFVYVGTENALSGWIASFARRMHPGAGTDWVLMPSFFWGALLLGRALAPFALRRAPEILMARSGLLLATLGACIVLTAASFSALAIGTILAGFGLASVFPITIAELSRRFGGSASRFVGGMFALGGLGGATLPWLVGFVSHHFDNLRSGLWIPVVGSLAMLVLYLLPWDRSSRRICG